MKTDRKGYVKLEHLGIFGGIETFIETVTNNPNYLKKDGLMVNRTVQKLLRKNQLSQCCDCLIVGSINDFSIRGESGWQSSCKKCQLKYRQNNREQLLEYYRERYQNNREQILEQMREYYQNNREQIREQSREYYQNNREQIREQSREYYQNNREYYREYRKNNREYYREYYQNNREQIREYNREHYQNNRERYREQRCEHYQNNRERYREQKREYFQTLNGRVALKKSKYKRRVLKKSNHVPYTTFQLIQRLGLFRDKCAYCDCHLPLKDKTVDHIIPISKGGADAVYNMIGVCSKCNSSKHNSDVFEWLRQSFEVTPYHKMNMISELMNPQIKHSKAIEILEHWDEPYYSDFEVNRFIAQMGRI